MLDMRDDAAVIEFPAFDSKYVSLETSAYDHYVNVPLSTTKGDFKKPTTMLFYTDRTKNYSGEPVKGVDKTLKMTGDFAIAFLRVAPHANEPKRMASNMAAMKTEKLMSLSEFRGKAKKPVSDVNFPAFSTDQKVFGDNFLEVMQFVFNHTTFDPNDEMDQKVLAALKPLGVEPGKTYDASTVAKIDGKRFAKVAEKVPKPPPIYQMTKAEAKRSLKWKGVQKVQGERIGVLEGPNGERFTCSATAREVGG